MKSTTERIKHIATEAAAREWNASPEQWEYAAEYLSANGINNCLSNVEALESEFEKLLASKTVRPGR